jgi:DNA replication protein DnaC
MTTTTEQWTRDTVYKDNERVRASARLFPPELVAINHESYQFQPEFLDAVRSEENWIPDRPMPVIPEDLKEQIGMSLLSCPICEDRRIYRFLVTGEETGITLRRERTCLCDRVRLYWDQLSRHVPERFRRVRLDAVVPSPLSRMSATKQSSLIEHLQTHPDGSYLFYGDAGTSKTYLAVALYGNALEAWAAGGWKSIYCPVVRVNVPTLLEQWVAKATNPEARVPDYSISQVHSCRNQRQRPRLFLDEIDKFKGSQFKLDKLLELVNAVYDEHGQIVATSNTSPEALTEAWGSFYGDAILRRIGQPPDGETICFQAD